jgi:predicted ArsR family transcriptional regulator
MPASSHRPQRLKTTRERIVTLLRRSGFTANEIGAQVGLTHNAVRGHLTALQREGVIREAGRQRGVSRPAVVYEIVPEAEAIFSRAYIPFVAHLLRVLRERVPPAELDEIMHLVGRRFASEWPRLRGDLPQRVEAASALLEGLGALHTIEKLDGGLVIRGHACLLAAAVHGRPEVCRAIESLLAELIDAPVRECCQRGERPRCCFEIGAPDAAADGPLEAAH